MAIVNLGSIKFNWKGAYAGGTAYAVDDVVSYNGSSYVCTAASTGNLPTDTNFWDQMSSAGTNGTDGTDLGTTLTTQGDIVYRDASGLARLPAGSANQVLQSGGTGANPSWGTVSSDFVKISETDLSSTGTLNLNWSSVSSTYDNYEIRLQCQLATSNAVQFRGIFGGSGLATSIYTQAVYNNTMNSSGTPGNSTTGQYSSYNQGYVNYVASTADAISATFQIINPNQTSKYKHVHIRTVFRDGGTYHNEAIGTIIRNTTALDGIQLIFNGTGGASNGKVSLWGLK